MEIHEMQSRRGRGGNGRSDRERGEDYFQFWQWNFCQNCWLLVSRSREPWQCLVSSLVLAWSCWIGICVVKLSISLWFFIVVFIASTLQHFFVLFLIFICIIVHSICRSIRRFNRPLYSLNFSLEFFIASTIWVELDIFIFSYLRPRLGLDFFYPSSITFIVPVITFRF